MSTRAVLMLACPVLLAGPLPAAAQLSPADREALVLLHDTERCAVDPAAAAMPALAWNPLLASVAQSYADACDVGVHNGSRKAQYEALGGSGEVGENIAWGGAGLLDLAQLWVDEKALWSYGPLTLANAADVAHYTQMIWAGTTSVGCGMADCTGTNFLVCDYAPAGNYIDQAPYVAGSGPNAACAALPEPEAALGGLAAAAALAALRAARHRRG